MKAVEWQDMGGQHRPTLGTSNLSIRTSMAGVSSPTLCSDTWVSELFRLCSSAELPEIVLSLRFMVPDEDLQDKHIVVACWANQPASRAPSIFGCFSSKLDSGLQLTTPEACSRANLWLQLRACAVACS